jgi:hypothetical protein
VWKGLGVGGSSWLRLLWKAVDSGQRRRDWRGHIGLAGQRGQQMAGAQTIKKFDNEESRMKTMKLLTKSQLRRTAEGQNTFPHSTELLLSSVSRKLHKTHFL